MSWLIKLFVGDVPGDCRLEDWALQFRGNDWFPWWIAVLVALVAFGFILLLYFRETARVSRTRRVVGAVLRTAAVAFLLFLLLRPVLVTELHCDKPRDVVLLIDNSLSMTLRDQRLSQRDQVRVAIAQDRLAPDTDLNTQPPGGTTIEQVSRGELVRAVLANPRLKLVERLADKGPLRAVLFGAQAHPVADDANNQEMKAADPVALRQRLIDVLDPAKNPNALTETQTALADVLAAVLQPRHGEDLPASVVIVTDGRDNASQMTLDQAARDCALAGVPLYVYGVGSSESGNLQLKEVAVAETLFSEDTASVAVRWRSQGFGQGRAEILVTLDGLVVARKEVPVKEGDDFREVLTFTTPKVGTVEKKLDLTATVRFLGQEAFTDDNTSTQSVRVMDRKVRVLYIEGQPRWEYKFLMQNLLRDRRVQARLLPIQGDPRALQSGVHYLPVFPATREELFAFDLIVLGDVPAAFFTNEQMEWVRDFVQEGGGLVAIAGQQSAPQTWYGKPLADVLPVEFTQEPKPAVDPNARTVAFQPMLTAEGRRREMLWLADTPEDNVKTWKELPGFYWYFPVTRLRAGAESLLVHPMAKAGEDPMPLAAWHFYGKGRVLYLGTDEVWRWRYNSGEKYIARFWGQIVYQMGMPHLVGNPKRVQMNLERTEAVVGQPMTAYVRILDPQFRPLTTETVSAKIERLDAKPGEPTSETVQLVAVQGQPGEYRVVLDNGKVGRYALKTESPESASLEYRVALPTHHELAVAGMAEEALRRLAEDSGGRFYREEDLKRLPDEVQPQTSPGMHRREVLIWQAWWVLLVFLGIVTAEWLLRKFSNLS